MLPSRSVARRVAAQKGEPVPTYETPSRVDELLKKFKDSGCCAGDTDINIFLELCNYAREQERRAIELAAECDRLRHELNDANGVIR
jgi:hypothetical protein